jgi:Domain of unknown function (DUF4328)
MSFTSLRRPAQFVVGALVVSAIVDVVAIIAGIDRIELLGRVASGGDYTASELQTSDDRDTAIGVVQLLLFAATAGLFIWWFARAYRNLDVFGSERRFGRGWAIGAWFVPFLNLVRPKRIADDIWEGSNPAGLTSDDASPITIWWTFFLGSVISAQIAFRAGAPDSPQELRLSAWLYLVSDSLDIVAALLAILVVRAITRRQDARATIGEATAPA